MPNPWDPGGPKEPQGDPRAPSAPLGGMGPWDPLGLFRSHSEWKAISSGRLFRKKSHSEVNAILKESSRRRMNGFRAKGIGGRGGSVPPIAQNELNCYQNQRFGPLGSPWPKMDENDPKNQPLGSLGGPCPEMVQTSLNETLRGFRACAACGRFTRRVSFKGGSNPFKRDPPMIFFPSSGNF